MHIPSAAVPMRCIDLVRRSCRILDTRNQGVFLALREILSICSSHFKVYRCYHHTEVIIATHLFRGEDPADDVFEKGAWLYNVIWICLDSAGCHLSIPLLFQCPLVR